MCRVIKVTGDSLAPLMVEGDFVLVLKIPFSFLKKGDVIVFRHSIYGNMVKLVESISHQEGTVSVIGTHPYSTDSRVFGPVGKKDILGKVVWRIQDKS